MLSRNSISWSRTYWSLKYISTNSWPELRRFSSNLFISAELVTRTGSLLVGVCNRKLQNGNISCNNHEESSFATSKPKKMKLEIYLGISFQIYHQGVQSSVRTESILWKNFWLGYQHLKKYYVSCNSCLCLCSHWQNKVYSFIHTIKIVPIFISTFI